MYITIFQRASFSFLVAWQKPKWKYKDQKYMFFQQERNILSLIWGFLPTEARTGIITLYKYKSP